MYVAQQQLNTTDVGRYDVTSGPFSLLPPSEFLTHRHRRNDPLLVKYKQFEMSEMFFSPTSPLTFLPLPRLLLLPCLLLLPRLFLLLFRRDH